MKKMKVLLMSIMAVGIMTVGLNTQSTENANVNKYSVYMMADGNTG
ncbi:TPA: Phr family secreted Rap phosphatase inhibitor [Bacillus cereus]|nr:MULTISPECIES: Phr family secreted Rap phosphatase inhibitor [Bacillus cereus group]PEF41655.1 Phr family secreted Rap phosphatase inhibitor [Bacillus wiedmannii]HDW3058639.1 Phr family secreted Rap phosphatase inhibitor [Bacillus cereus]